MAKKGEDTIKEIEIFNFEPEIEKIKAEMRLKRKKYVYMIDKVTEYRGIILTNCIGIENFLSQIIAEYSIRSLDKEARLKFLSGKFSRKKFVEKIKIFNNIVKNNYPDLYKLYKEHIDKLKNIKNTRNKISHYFFDYTEELDKEGEYPTTFCLQSYKNGKLDEYNINKDECDEYTKLCKETLQRLLEIKLYIREDIQGNENIKRDYITLFQNRNKE